MPGKLFVSASLFMAISMALLCPENALAWPPGYYRAAYANSNNMAQYAARVAAYQNAVQIAAYQRAVQMSAYQYALQAEALRQAPIVPSVYGLPPGLYSLAYRRAAMQRGSDISWAQQRATMQLILLNRFTGGGSSGGDGPAASGD